MGRQAVGQMVIRDSQGGKSDRFGWMGSGWVVFIGFTFMGHAWAG